MHGHGLRLVRRFGIGVTFAALVAASLAVAATAAAASPDVIQLKYGGAFTAGDFCGTGTAIDVSYSGHFTGWLAPNQPVDNRNHSAGLDVYTNASNGTTVTVRYSYSWTGTLVSGNLDGPHTFEWTFKGAAEVVRPVGGGVISRDAGHLIVLATFDGDELIDTEVILDHGGHPGWQAFCNTIAPALGLT